MTPVASGLADRAEITGLVSRYFGAIDDKRLDRAAVEAVFTVDGRLTRPNGASLVGPEAIAAGQSESFARFRATQHVSSDQVVDLDGGTARIRANLIAMHLWADQERDPHTLETHFLAGGVLRAVAARTSHGWRLSEMSMRNTWRTGSGYGAMLATGRSRPHEACGTLTAHRPVAEHQAIFEEYVGPFALPGVRSHLGGASGIDSLALLWLADETEVELMVAVPAKLTDQRSRARSASASPTRARTCWPSSV